MATTSSLDYSDILSNFLGYIDDYDLAEFDESEMIAAFNEWLHKAVSKSYVRRLFSSFELHDEIQTVYYELVYKTDEYADKDFVTDILAKGVVVEWVHPIVKRKSILAQWLTSSKESKFYSQSAHLTVLRSLLEDVQLELRNAIRDRGYIFNSYLEESK